MNDLTRATLLLLNLLLGTIICQAAEETTQCCGGPGSTRWRYYRVVNQDVVDEDTIMVGAPTRSIVVIPGDPDNGKPQLRFVVTKFGDGIEPGKGPHLKGNPRFFFGYVPNIGSISAALVDEGEHWVFQIDGKAVEASTPVDPQSVDLEVSYVNIEGVTQTVETTILPNSNSIRECKNQAGEIISKVYFASNSIGYFDLQDLRDKGFAFADVPEELGWVAIWPSIAGSNYEIKIADYVFTQGEE